MNLVSIKKLDSLKILLSSNQKQKKLKKDNITLNLLSIRASSQEHEFSINII